MIKPRGKLLKLPAGSARRTRKPLPTKQFHHDLIVREVLANETLFVLADRIPRRFRTNGGRRSPHASWMYVLYWALIVITSSSPKAAAYLHDKKKRREIAATLQELWPERPERRLDLEAPPMSRDDFNYLWRRELSRPELVSEFQRLFTEGACRQAVSIGAGVKPNRRLKLCEPTKEMVIYGDCKVVKAPSKKKPGELREVEDPITGTKSLVPVKWYEKDAKLYYVGGDPSADEVAELKWLDRERAKLGGKDPKPKQMPARYAKALEIERQRRSFGLRYAMLHVRNGHPNERITLAVAWTPHGEHEMATVHRQTEEVRKHLLDPTVFSYDKASSTGADAERMMQQRLMLVSPSKDSPKNKETGERPTIHPIELITVTLNDGRKMPVQLYAQKQALGVKRVDASGKTVFWQLPRLDMDVRRNGTAGEPGSYRWYGTYQLPPEYHDKVIRVRLNQTHDDLYDKAGNKRKRPNARSHYLRGIAEAYPEFHDLYYRRADAEAIHSQIDASLRHQRARAYGWARGTMCLLAYAFVQNAIAVASCRYRMAVARGDTEPEAA